MQFILSKYILDTGYPCVKLLVNLFIYCLFYDFENMLQWKLLRRSWIKSFFLKRFVILFKFCKGDDQSRCLQDKIVQFKIDMIIYAK